MKFIFVKVNYVNEASPCGQTRRFVTIRLLVVSVSLFPHNFNPRKIHFWQFLWPQLFSALSRAHEFGIKMLPIQKPIILE